MCPFSWKGNKNTNIEKKKTWHGMNLVIYKDFIGCCSETESAYRNALLRKNN